MTDRPGTRISLLFGLMLILIGGIVLAGCEFRRISINDPIDRDDVVFVVPGQTTLSEVVTRLGAPDEMTGAEDRTVFHYRFRVTKSMRVNFGWILRFFSPFAPNMSLARSNLGTDELQITFTPHWIVRDLAFSVEAEQTHFNPLPL